MNRIESKTESVENFNGWTGESLIKQCGASYVAGRDVVDIAKDIRKLIREAVKAGYLPKMKTSVRIERYSMGRTINVVVAQIDDTVINVDAWRTQAANSYNESWADLGGMHNDRGRFVLATLTQFVDAFRKSEEHGQSDYSNCNFHSDINFDASVHKQQFEKLAEQ